MVIPNRALQQLFVIVGILLCAIAPADFVARTAGDEPSNLKAPAAKTNENRSASDPKDDDEAKKTAFLRLQRNSDKDPTALEVAITRYETSDGSRPGVIVDLVGAIHVADPEYYAELNKRFADYESVLYELVAPEGTRVPKGGEAPKSGVSMVQSGMTKALNLSFQLDEVDYTRENFVHADLSPEEFAKSMKDRGESVVTIFFRLMGQSMAQQSKKSARGNDVKMLAALFSRDRDQQLKILMAEQFADMDGGLSALNGPDGSTLVTVRNTRAIDVLKRELRQGKKKIAIFYGAAHMPDLEKQLAADLKMEPTEQEWLQAWDLTAPSKGR